MQEKARQARIEEKERKESEPKVPLPMFDALSLAPSSHGEEEKSFFTKFKRFPSIVRKLSAASTSNGQANVENKEIGKRLSQTQTTPIEEKIKEITEGENSVPEEKQNGEPFAEEDLVKVSLMSANQRENDETNL